MEDKDEVFRPVTDTEHNPVEQVKKALDYVKRTYGEEEPQVITCSGGAVLPPFSARVPQEVPDGE